MELVTIGFQSWIYLALRHEIKNFGVMLQVNQCFGFNLDKSILITVQKLTLKCSQTGSLILL
jgi:hypothetical protein